MQLCSCSGAAKKEEAADLYVRAANTYKLAKNWSGKPLILAVFCNSLEAYLVSRHERFNFLCHAGAGNAFCQAAQIQLNFLANKHEAATHYIDAANCYKKSDNDGKTFLTTKCFGIVWHVDLPTVSCFLFIFSRGDQLFTTRHRHLHRYGWFLCFSSVVVNKMQRAHHVPKNLFANFLLET